MDRNTIIATVLIALIMVGWLVWLGPQAPPATPPDTAPADTSAALDAPLPADTGDVDEPEGLQVPVAPSPRDSVLDATLAGTQEGTERTITVETDLYEARLSTRGATLTSFQLKEYQQAGDTRQPVQLVDTSSTGALALVFTTPTNRVVDSRDFLFDVDVDGDVVQVADQPVEISFETRVGEGRIRQTYVFQPGEYEVELRVEQVNAAAYSTSEGYELVWDGGLPFSEGDHPQEAERAGAYGRSGGEVEEISLLKETYEEVTLRGVVEWVAVKSKYFTAALIPTGETRGAELLGERVGELDTPSQWEDYIVSLMMPPAEGASADEFRLYLGPIEFYRITDYDLGLYDIVDYGWDFFEWITRPLAKFIFIPIFVFLGGVLPNYGLVIIALALLIKIVVYPLTKTSFRSMARMRELQPKMEAIKEKYGDNPQKQQEAMMKMYRETGVNPLGGCLPMLLQYPIIIALWQYLPQAIEIRQKGFLWAHDLSAPDVILNLPFTIPLYGDFVGGFTLLMGLSMIVQMRIQMTPSTNPQAKIMTYVFPVMIFAIFNKFAAGLSLYYLCYNILTAAQQKWINHQLEKEGISAKPGQNGKGGTSDASKAKRRGKQRSKSK